MNALARSLTIKQFMEWEAYAELEPFDETREDYRIASIVTMMANLWGREHDKRGRVKGKAYTLEDFVLKFEEPVQKPKQDTFALMKIMAEVNNYAESQHTPAHVREQAFAAVEQQRNDAERAALDAAHRAMGA